MVYNHEWPKTATDFEKLYTMKSFDLQKIKTNINEVDGKKYTTGIKFTFYGEKNSIKYGKFDGTNSNKTLFKSSE